jgi:pyridoxine/pyridoxamine 5'-phosphate oxidase
MFADTLTDEDRIDRDPLCQDALDKAWKALEAGATSGNPFNFLQLATVNERGEPEARTIVLRQANRNEAALYFVTDSRSPKMADIAHNHTVALVGYDPASRVQIRLTGIAGTVGDHAKLANQWNLLSERTRDSFNSPVASGARMQSDGTVLPDVQKASMSPFERCCLMRVELATLERLDISQTVHLRFCFVRSDRGWLGTRRAP